jgi:hypothetical protein
VIFALLIACGEDAAPDPEAPLAPTPYLVEEEALPPPALDATALEDALQTALDAAWSLEASPILRAYAEVSAYAEPGCPDLYDNEGNVYWYDQCTTSGGARFDGYGFTVLYDGYVGEDGYVYEGAVFSGVGRVVDPEGHTFTAGGTAYAIVARNTGIARWQSVIQGSFGWDGPAARGTWMEDTLEPDLSLLAAGADASDSGRAVALDGSVGGFEGEVSAVLFDNLLLYTSAWGSTCPTEPGGSVSLRAREGGWYDVLFDGPAEFGGTSEASRCDGCGEAWFRGERVGEVCVDMTRLLDWTEAPW